MELGKSVFSKRKYLFCLTFNRRHLPINLDLSEVNSLHFILGLFCAVHTYKITTFYKTPAMWVQFLVHASHLYTPHGESIRSVKF